MAGNRAMAPLALMALVGLGALGSGCGKSERAVVPAVEPERRLTGITTLAFLPDPSNVARRLPEDEELLTPSPLETPAPIYPPHLLRTACTDGVVFLRIIIGEDGAVRETSDSPLGDSTPGECGRAFRTAVEEAVAVWRFEPALWRRLAPGEDYDEDGKPDFQRVLESRRIVVYVDIRIDFALVDGRPEVTIQQAQAA